VAKEPINGDDLGAVAGHSARNVIKAMGLSCARCAAAERGFLCVLQARRSRTIERDLIYGVHRIDTARAKLQQKKYGIFPKKRLKEKLFARTRCSSL
jgi:hypothetical protein